MVLCVTVNCKNCKIPVNHSAWKGPIMLSKYAGVSFYIKKTIYILSRVAGLLACRFRPCFGPFLALLMTRFGLNLRPTLVLS